MVDTAIPVRVLCLGNDLVADDAIGWAVGDEIRRRFPCLDVVAESMTGLYLLDDVIGVERLVVVDAMMTGEVSPGTIRVFGEAEVDVVHGTSPHYVGLFETLDLARALGLAVPQEVVLVGIEIKDAVTIGGDMSRPVRDALPRVVDLVTGLAQN